jgi:hypothetical protein
MIGKAEPLLERQHENCAIGQDNGIYPAPETQQRELQEQAPRGLPREKHQNGDLLLPGLDTLGEVGGVGRNQTTREVINHLRR